MGINTKQTGFTLIEVALVLVIVTVILGYTLAMLPVQQELRQYRQAEQEMDEIIDALYAFVQGQGYLPCPAWQNGAVTSNGFECREDGGAVDCNGNDPAVDSCDVWYGFVPGRTLGINGRYSAGGLLLDPWGQPYRYQVTNFGVVGGFSPNEDFVFRDEAYNEAVAAANDLQALQPNLEICTTDQSPGSAGIEGSCLNASQTVVSGIPAIIHSTGKDTAGDVAGTSWIQRENLDNSTADRVFILTTRSDVANAEYDDLLRWVAPNVLYAKIIEAKGAF